MLRLHDSDRLPDVLESFAMEKNISSALCFFVGGAKDKSRVVVGPEDGEIHPPKPMISFLAGVHEMCGLGTIFLNEEGKPKLHMHAAFGRQNKTTTGCVRLGVDVWQIGEVVIIELIGTTTKRAKDLQTGFEFLEIE